MTYTLSVETCGNPDFDQNYNQPFELTPGFTARVNDFAAASAVFRDWRDANGVGGGNMRRADILRGNEVVARVSYNGRVWPPGDWVLGQTSLYDPA